MGVVNFYFIHLNPRLIDFSKEKSKIIKETFKSYKKNIDKTATLGEVRLFSFSPKTTEAYSDILECYIPFMKGPCVLVCYSIFDIAPTNRTACGRVDYILTSDKMETVYFYNYDPKNDVRTYYEKIVEIFRYSANRLVPSSRSIKRPQSALDNSELIQKVMALRLCSPPVKYEDLSRISGISDSTLRRLGRYYDNSNTFGVDISSDQETYLKDEMGKIHRYNLKRYDTMEETFLP